MLRCSALSMPVAAIAAFFATACVSTRSEDGRESAGAASALKARNAPGSYRVPVEAALEYAATSPVNVKFAPRGAGVMRLQYDLPAVIAGPGQRVDLEGRQEADGTWTLEGGAGIARCTQSRTGSVRCDETLPGLRANLAGAQAAIDERYPSEAENAARAEVAQRFSVDPLGVLTFELFDSAIDSDGFDEGAPPSEDATEELDADDEAPVDGGAFASRRRGGRRND